MIAHVSGVPVEELPPLVSASGAGAGLLLARAWFGPARRAAGYCSWTKAVNSSPVRRVMRASARGFGAHKPDALVAIGERDQLPAAPLGIGLAGVALIGHEAATAGSPSAGAWCAVSGSTLMLGMIEPTTIAPRSRTPAPT